MMKNKRIFVRIGAILACILLVGALALPCFAAAPSLAGSDFDAFYVIYGAERAESYRQTFDRSTAYSTFYRRFTDWYDMAARYEYISAGIVNQGALSLAQLQPTLIDGEGVAAEFVSMWRDVGVTLYAKSAINQSVLLDIGSDSFDIELFCVDLGTDTPFLSLSFYYDDESVCEIQYEVIDGYWRFQLLNVSERSYSLSSLSEFSICISAQNSWNVDFANNISLLLFGVSRAVYPRAEYDGFIRAWSDGRDIAIEREADAYEQGLEDGDGDYYVGYDDGFQIGYNEAVRQIDSGEYGDMLLGNTFAAPIKALDQVVIAKLPDGTEITILGVLSAAVSLSLFMIFLKKFAGG